MKYKIHATTAMLMLSTLSFAGGNMSDVEEISTVEEVTQSSGFYAGLGFGSMKLENDLTDESFKANTITLQAGYQYNNYMALEARYTHHIGDVVYDHGSDASVNAGADIADYPTDFSNIAIYLKPMYSFNAFSVYALFGYGEVELTNVPRGSVDRVENGFQWGVGAAYDMTETISLYADYVAMYDDKGFDYRASNADIKVDAVTLGLTYRF